MNPIKMNLKRKFANSKFSPNANSNKKRENIVVIERVEWQVE